MKNWEKVRLSDVCTFVRGPFGGSLKKNIFKTEGYAVYEQQHAIYDQFEDIRYFIDDKKFNEMKRFELKSGDLIMSCSGTMGKIAIVPEKIEKGIINQALLKLTPSKKISTVFLKLWMQSESFQESLKEYSGGAAIQNVASVAILKQIQVPLPSIAEQERIVSVLDEAFAAIAKAKANAEQNLKNAKELFESYLQSVFENPENNWESIKLGDICKFVRGPFGGSLKKGIFKAEGYAVYEQQHAIYDQFDKIRYFIDETKFNEMKRFELKSGDLIMSCSGTMGKIALVPPVIKEGIINQALLKLSPSKAIKKEFLKLWMESKSFQNSLKDNAGGAAIQNVASVSILKNIEIPLPSLIEQNKVIESILEFSIKTRILEKNYQQKLFDLEELKKSILQKAFSGELKTAKPELV